MAQESQESVASATYFCEVLLSVTKLRSLRQNVCYLLLIATYFQRDLLFARPTFSEGFGTGTSDLLSMRPTFWGPPRYEFSVALSRPTALLILMWIMHVCRSRLLTSCPLELSVTGARHSKRCPLPPHQKLNLPCVQRPSQHAMWSVTRSPRVCCVGARLRGCKEDGPLFPHPLP